MKYQPHPIADIFPLLEGEELAELAADIKAKGLRNPIWLYEGKILDGRNRAAACVNAGVPISTREFRGDALAAVAFVWSENVTRRHLDAGQKAAAFVKREQAEQSIQAATRQATEAAAERQRAAGAQGVKGGRPPKEKTLTQPVVQGLSKPPAPKPRAPMALDTVAKAAGVSRETLRQARILHQQDPKRFEQVAAGKATLKQVAKELRRDAHAKALEEARAVQKPSTWRIAAAEDAVTCAAVITDPPYGILDEPWEPKDLQKFTETWARKWDSCAAEFVVSFYSQAHIWAGRNWFDEALSSYTFQQLLIWHYPNNKSPQNRQGFKQTWEPIFVYRKTGSSRPIKPQAATWGEGLTDFDCHVAPVPQSNFTGADLKTHPAQKPVSVMRWLIAALTLPGELVCDPFCGSGTTGVAATQLGRQFYGIEKDAAFRKLAEGRISKYGRL